MNQQQHTTTTTETTPSIEAKAARWMRRSVHDFYGPTNDGMEEVYVDSLAYWCGHWHGIKKTDARYSVLQRLARTVADEYMKRGYDAIYDAIMGS